MFTRSCSINVPCVNVLKRHYLQILEFLKNSGNWFCELECQEDDHPGSCIQQALKRNRRTEVLTCYRGVRGCGYTISINSQDLARADDLAQRTLLCRRGTVDDCSPRSSRSPLICSSMSCSKGNKFTGSDQNRAYCKNHVIRIVRWTAANSLSMINVDATVVHITSYEYQGQKRHRSIASYILRRTELEREECTLISKRKHPLKYQTHQENLKLVQK